MTQTPVLLFIKVDWCGYCRAAKPIMDKVASALGQTVTVRTVDGDADKQTVEQFGVTSYPSIFLITGSSIKKFEGERTFDNLIGFVCEHGTTGDFCGTIKPK